MSVKPVALICLVAFILCNATQPIELPSSRMITDQVLSALGSRMHAGGYVLFSNASTFGRVTRQWNARFDSVRPRAAIYCMDHQEVEETILTLNHYDDCYTVRSAGHSFPGYATLQGCVLVDVSNLRSTRYDAETSRVIIGPGVTFWDFTTFLGSINRTTTHGFGPTVAFGGYTQGGGVGLTHRKYGLAIDNLLAATVVLPNGTTVEANHTSHSDLFWALRGGGGGNWGTVTQYTFQTYDASDPVLYVMFSWKFKKELVQETGNVWQQYFKDNHDPDFGLYWRITGNPVLGELGTTIQIYGIWTGELDAGHTVMNDYIALFPTAPHSHEITPMAIDTAYKKFMGPFKSTPHTGFFLQSRLLQNPLEPAAFPKLADQLDKLHFLKTFALIWMDPFGGKVNQVNASSTAFPWRDAFANFAIFVFYLQEDGHGWGNTEEQARDWMAETWSGLEPHMGKSSVYINFCFDNATTGQNPNWQDAYYGDNLRRLQSVKARYDPINKMSFPQSVAPVYTPL